MQENLLIGDQNIKYKEGQLNKKNIVKKWLETKIKVRSKSLIPT